MSNEKRKDDIELGEKLGDSFSREEPPAPRHTPAIPAAAASQPVFSILSYCASSILMTVTNKYVLSGTDYNLNFFLLCVQVGSKTHTGLE